MILRNGNNTASQLSYIDTRMKICGSVVSSGHFLHSRIPQSKTALFDWTFFDWILLILFFVSRVDFIVFVLFLEAFDVREYCCMAVQNRLAGLLCFARSSRATRASRTTNLRPSGLVALGLAESRHSYVRGVVLSRESPKPQQA